jgi:DNA-binding winged helix-turn-helix (wHTH) protein
MTTSSARRALYRENPPPNGAYSSSPAAADAMLEFGRFCVLLRRRQLVADGVPIALGTRAFDLLLVLLEADGSLVTKEELMSRVWPGIVVAEENLKVQIAALRKALGEDRDFIRTEFGRGYRFTAAVRSTPPRALVSTRRDGSTGQLEGWVPNGLLADHCTVGVCGRFDTAHSEGPESRRDWISSAMRKKEGKREIESPGICCWARPQHTLISGPCRARQQRRYRERALRRAAQQ